MSSENFLAETEVVKTITQCDEAVKKLRQHCKRTAVLGFDCEFNTPSQIDLIQLCSTEGYCVLFRLRHIGRTAAGMPDMPDSLEELLGDEGITKVGVGTADDAKKINNSFSVRVNKTLDLRFLAVKTGYNGERLASLYEQIFGKKLKNDKSIGKWDTDELTPKQIEHAASDARACIEIYEKLIKKFWNPSVLNQYYDKFFNPHYHSDLQRVQMPREETSNVDNLAATVAIGATAAIGATLAYLLFSDGDKSVTKVVQTITQCDEAVKKLRQHCKGTAVLGFDCEFNDPSRIDLIQLCSTEGYCVLFMLGHITRTGMPDSLKELLGDEGITKVGVGTADDAMKINNSFSVRVNKTLDLRSLAVKTGYKGESLASLYEQIFDKKLKNDKSIGEWDKDELTPKQIEHAASDARACIEIYEKLIKKFWNPSVLNQYYDKFFNPHYHSDLQRVDNECVLQ